jgi:hypothetical protein
MPGDARTPNQSRSAGPRGPPTASERPPASGRRSEDAATVPADALITAALSSARPRRRAACAVIAAAGRTRREDDPATRRGNRSAQRTVQPPMMTTVRWFGPRVRWLLPAACLVLVSASCGVRPAATHPAQHSGATALIFGVVQASPGCPVERQDHPCKPRALGDVRVEARSLPARVTASTRTRVDSHYFVGLGKGRYVLAAVTRQVLPRCPHVLVAVTSPAPIRANIKLR